MPRNEVPRTVFRRLRGTTVGFRLDIDIEGDVSGCRLEGEALNRVAEEAICATLTRNAEFAPGLDEGGNPATGYYMNSINF
ncbi:MAG: hypothetical protein HKN78_00570 [Sphingomonadaceae bacterium]|nr:hypothetical protein [Sphingomonadaceae bacterium]